MTNIIENYKNRITFDIVRKIYCDKIYLIALNYIL